MVGKILEKDTYASAMTHRPASMATWCRRASSTRPRWCARRCKVRRRVAGLLITTEAMVAEVPKKQEPRRCRGRRWRRYGRHGLLSA